MLSNRQTPKSSGIAGACAGIVLASLASFLSVVFPVAPSEAQINVTSTRSGTCYSGRNRLPCYYPSANGLYSNVKSIEFTGGSGADVFWQSFNLIDWTGGWSGGPVLTFGGKTFAPTGISSCVIGSSRYRQSTICQNPYRGSQRFVRVVVRPHNANWQTNFRLNPE